MRKVDVILVWLIVIVLVSMPIMYKIRKDQSQSEKSVIKHYRERPDDTDYAFNGSGKSKDLEKWEDDIPEYKPPVSYVAPEEKETIIAVPENEYIEELVSEEVEPSTTVSDETIHKSNKVILDLDFSDDVDDVLAVSVAAYYHHNNDIELVGAALECTSIRACMALNALLQAHKLYNIPTAVDNTNGIVMHGPYHLGMESYPHETDYNPDTVKFYRKLLSESEDKVNIITTGQVITLQRLLQSEPDGISSLSGAELVKDKVEHLYVVGCKASGKPENNMFYVGTDYGNNKWYGTNAAGVAGGYVADNWPTEITFMFAELGGMFNVGQFYHTSDKGCTDIITRALSDYSSPNGRQAFDPMGVYIAVESIKNNLTGSNLETERGIMKIWEDGSSTWTPSPSGNHLIVRKLTEDSFYASEINKQLAYEFTLRTGKEVK